MMIFLFIAGVVVALAIIMTINKVKKKPKNVMDDLTENKTFKNLKNLVDAMSELNNNATAEDIMPEGYGEFGHDLTNPIPVNSIMGNIAYLGKLRTLDGDRIQYNRIGSTKAPNIDMPIDTYRIIDNGKIIATLYISPYNKKNSQRSPKGFKLVDVPK